MYKHDSEKTCKMLINQHHLVVEAVQAIKNGGFATKNNAGIAKTQKEMVTVVSPAYTYETRNKWSDSVSCPFQSPEGPAVRGWKGGPHK